MTDYKQLCAELVAWAEKTSAHYYSEPRVLIRARAALAEPEPEGVTDEELDELFTEIDQSGEPQSWRAYARAVLARWGNHPGSPDSSTLQPVPITERLPEPEDCDGEGNVWAWRRFDPEGDMDNGDFWCLAFCEWLGDEDSGFTHWLPAHALPVPS